MGVLNNLSEKRLLWPTVMTLVALPMLTWLGMWQLDRLAWKEALIAAIATRSKADPVDLLTAYREFQAEGFAAGALEYKRVKARGRFHHDKERYFYAPDPERGPGYHVYTPFEITGNSSVVFVNRGFVPEAFKDPGTRRSGQIDGEVEVTGLLRAPGQQGRFTPDNERKANLWYWRDFSGMFVSAFENTERPYIPVFLDAEGEAPGGWPKGGVTRLELPNRHLEYALTWFGLAAALGAVYLAYAVPRFRQ